MCARVICRKVPVGTLSESHADVLGDGSLGRVRANVSWNPEPGCLDIKALLS
jgi:hypothetical protein